MEQFTIAPRGPFRLSASLRFLRDATLRESTPAGHADGGDGVFRLAFPVDDDWRLAVVRFWQREGEGTLLGSVQSAAPAGLVRIQVERVLAVEEDGSALAGIAARDPVLAGLLGRHAGARPVRFPSPYEAACSMIIGHRIRALQARALTRRIAEWCGTAVDIDGRRITAFPTPRQLIGAPELPGMSVVKDERLRAVARAALEGRLSGKTLRARKPRQAIEMLRELPGIGPFFAEQILLRGAGVADVFPLHDTRLHETMAREYGLPADPAVLAGIAATWAPLRGWISWLWRVYGTEAGTPAEEVEDQPGSSKSSAPMSSAHTAGKSWMNRSINVRHSAESSTTSSTPDSRSECSGPRKVVFSPMTTRGIP